MKLEVCILSKSVRPTPEAKLQEAAPHGVSCETDSESESPAPVLNSPLLMQAAETTLAISGPADPDSVLPNSNFEPEIPESINGRDHVASMTFLETHMTDQEAVLNMDTGLAGSAMEHWWEEVCAVPTLLVGNATFLKDSPPPILPQW